MKIVIAHLYYDLLNLYGESGNVKALKKYLENQGIKVTLENKSVNDEFNFDKYDFVYIGSGTENNLKIALNDLKRYKNEIKEYIENDKFILTTGNSLEMFSKEIDTGEEEIEALSILDYNVIWEDKRYVCESVLRYNAYDIDIIGFQNRCGFIYNNKYSCFEVIKGYSSDNKGDSEGILYKNYLATYNLGPLLARNPLLLEIVSKELILSKDKKYKLKKVDMDLEMQAYQNDKEKYLNK